MKREKERTLVFLYNKEKEQILLAMKKRGFGEGKWNGVGGKLEKGESVRHAAVREAREEIGVRISEGALDERGVIHFSFEDDAEEPILVHVFFVYTWSEVPTESEEMCPQWYNISTIPYDEMWVDDKHWLPDLLVGKKSMNRHFHLSCSSDEILYMD